MTIRFRPPSNVWHDAMIDIYHGRYGMQIETADTEEVLDAWGDG